MPEPEEIKDSDYLRDSQALQTIKRVLTKEFNVDAENLLGKVVEYEDKADDMGSVAWAIPNIDLTHLTAILRADGKDVSPEHIAASQAEWAADKINETYEEYDAAGRFDTGETDNS